MRKFMILVLSAAALVLLGVAPAAQAQEAVSLTNSAIVDLTDYPGAGARASAFNAPDDFAKRSGADIGKNKTAAAKLQDALNKTNDPKAKAQLELAVDYAKAGLHKEARLSAQGALYYLCQSGGGEGCDKAPKFGSYVAP